jgi:tRNA nucleotidyltransferase (CCA-adding enzyme)
LHDLAKPRCFTRGEDGRGHFYGHNLAGAELAEGILRRLRCSTQEIRVVTTLIREHMIDLKMGPAGIRRLVGRVGRQLIPALLAVRQADIMAHSPGLVPESMAELEAFRVRLAEVLEQEGDYSLRELAVGGDDVMRVLDCGPGPQVGAVLQLLWDEVLACPELNRRELLLRRITAFRDDRRD